MTQRAPAALSATSVALLAVLAGCGGSEPAPEMGTIRTEPLPAPEAELPIAQPNADGECPYLSVEEVAGVGIGPVTGVRIDDSLDPAACFFYGTDDEVIITTTVHTADSAERAAEIVAETAPADVAEEAAVKGGWIGAGTEGPGGVLLVLSRGDQLLAVQTVHEESGPATAAANLVGPRIDG
ncbi:MAG TPA: DUF2020 domain-containing protein [Candidatus Dietzia merdigallinarum]|nr:DUF2020 domain-containing protein [Candidatus Dietzia merdigallinarum]